MSNPMLRRLLALTLVSTPLFGAGCSSSPERELSISTDFEGASLESWEVVEEGRVELTLALDTQSEEYRWYSFLVEGSSGDPLTFSVLNAGGSNAAGAWAYNRPAVSEDGGRSWQEYPLPADVEGVYALACA